MIYTIPEAINNDTFLGLRITTVVNGSPLNLTGGSVVMNVDCLGNNFEFSTRNGRMEIINPPTSGIVEISKQIVSFPAYGIFPYEMIFYLSNGDVHTYLNGTWAITRP